MSYCQDNARMKRPAGSVKNDDRFRWQKEKEKENFYFFFQSNSENEKVEFQSIEKS